MTGVASNKSANELLRPPAGVPFASERNLRASKKSRDED
jgi:hypothetical protein